ncbi:hypothetical protein AgCh_022848 [Apium graveolens]
MKKFNQGEEEQTEFNNAEESTSNTNGGARGKSSAASESVGMGQIGRIDEDAPSDFVDNVNWQEYDVLKMPKLCISLKQVSQNLNY